MRFRSRSDPIDRISIIVALFIVHAFFFSHAAKAQFRASTLAEIQHRTSDGVDPDLIDRDEDVVVLPPGAGPGRDLLSVISGAASNDLTFSAVSQYQETLLGGDFGVRAQGSGGPAAVANHVLARAAGVHSYQLNYEDFPVPIQDIRMQSFVPIEGFATAQQLGLANDTHSRVVVDWGYSAMLRGRIPGEEDFDDFEASATVDGMMTFNSLPGEPRPEITVSGQLADDVMFAEVLYSGIIPGWSAEGASLVDLSLGQIEGLDYQLSLVYTLEATIDFFDEEVDYQGAAGIADFLNTGSFELSLVDLDDNPIPGIEFVPIPVPEPSSAALLPLAFGYAFALRRRAGRAQV